MCVFIVTIIFISSGEGPGNNGRIFVSIKHNWMFHDFWTKKQRHMTAYIWKYKILVHDHSWRRCFCLSIHFHKISVKPHAMTKIHLSLISSIATCSRVQGNHYPLSPLQSYNIVSSYIAACVCLYQHRTIYHFNT